MGFANASQEYRSHANAMGKPHQRNERFGACWTRREIAMRIESERAMAHLKRCYFCKQRKLMRVQVIERCKTEQARMDSLPFGKQQINTDF